MNFKLPYDRTEYIEFFRTQFLPEDFEAISEGVSLSFSPQYTQQVTKMGQSSSLDMNVYEVQHASENDPRVSLSKESFKLLAEYGQKRALVLFISQTSPNYRLSLVTIDLKWEEGKRPTREYSNPRRYSFFLGPDAKIHTSQEYLAKPGRVRDIEDLKRRFSIEVVNKDFYTQIAILFTKLTGGKRKVGSQRFDEKGILVFPSPDDTKRKEFAVRLIGRLVFCWFLKKKLSNQGVPLLPEELLSTDAVKGNRHFYHSILEPLFFEVLNTPMDERKKQYQAKPWMLIPFLNGGLFTPHEDDYYGKNEDERAQLLNTLKVPNNWLGDLIEIFETYNFTIDENTPVDVELSIEPEMLGRIFENLLAEINPETGETARKATGSYYTPRPIVEYMVDESLKQYLLANTSVSETGITSLLSYTDEELGLTDSQKDEVLDALDTIKVLDPACGSGAFPMGVLQKILLLLQKIDPDSKKWLGKILAKIDDAIVRKEFERKLEREALEYVHKLGIIRDAIYGVDIQPIAVEISKLRCFLSLIVDETIDDTQPNRAVEPLPNLEFKFVCANSLIGLDSSRLTTQKAMELKDKLKKLRADYLVSYGDEKRHAEQEFRQIQSKMARLSLDWGEGSVETLKLADWKPFKDEPCAWFDPDWMFGIGDSFDVLIANPPYIGEKGHKTIFQEIAEGTLGRFYKRRMDLFYFFFHLALDLCKNKGQVAFISTNYYPTADGAKNLRLDFKQRATIRTLINFNELRIFESALGQHNMLTLLTKGCDADTVAKTCITKNTGFANSEILQNIVSWQDKLTDYYSVKQQALYEGEESYIRFGGKIEDTDDPIQKLLAKLAAQENTLKSVCNLDQGIVTGADKVRRKHIEKYKIAAKLGDGIFVLTKQELLSKRINLDSKHVRPWFKNSDIRRYYTSTNTNSLVLYFKDEKHKQPIEPEIFEHFELFKTALIARLSVCKKNKFQWNIVSKWIDRGEYYLLFYPRKPEVFESPKIVVPQRSKTNIFGYNEIPWYASADVYFITQKDRNISLKYVLALLNSKLFYVWLYHKGKRKGETLELYLTPLSQIPFKKIASERQRPFTELVDKIIAAKKSDPCTDTKHLESQIDQMVYKLYDLTPEEIAIVEEHSKAN